SGWWVDCNHNWNLVCHSSLIIGAIAVADTDPQYEAQILPVALKSLPIALKQYGPDGAWGEGPGYWEYATRYMCYGLAALRTAKGDDYALSEYPGLPQTGAFPLYSTGPTDMPLGYADCWAGLKRYPSSALMWLAGAYGDGFVANYEHYLIEKTNIYRPEDIIWYVPQTAADHGLPPLDKYYRGPVEVAFMRSAWNDPDALFLGIKAGYNRVNHAHLDLGNFELDALGVRWAWDMGSDQYHLPGYFDAKSGRRWQYYRINSHSHNIPTFGGESQSPDGKASVSRFVAGQREDDTQTMPFAEIDLSNAYGEQVVSYFRGAALVENRRAALIQDEIELPTPTDLVWGFTTKADVTIDGSTATLTEDGQSLTVRVLAPADVGLALESAEQPKPENPNKGYRRVVFHLKAPAGPLRIAVLFAPRWTDGEAPTPEIQPLAEWGGNAARTDTQ
ncbi:MAG: heparinase II/III domain-containing protein, partial [Puniceicoccales bacterium]